MKNMMASKIVIRITRFLTMTVEDINQFERIWDEEIILDVKIWLETFQSSHIRTAPYMEISRLKSEQNLLHIFTLSL